MIDPLASPAEGGVAAFSRALSAALGAVESIRVGEGREGTGSLRRALRRTPTAPSVLLHYVNYGFQRRGCPAGLVSTICRNRNSIPGFHLVTLFHEVYAFGPPWRSSFWLSPVQRRLARQLARASDACVTSTAPFAEVLRRWVPKEKVTVLPVFSTIGEPESVEEWDRRTPRMVVFGSPGVRERAYHETLDQLTHSVRVLQVEEVADIGPPADVPEEVAGVPVRELGHLPPAEVRDLLGSSRFGFVAYPPHLLGKSSVFAAYEAHGLCPVIGWPHGGLDRADGEGMRWLPAWGEARAEADIRVVAAGALARYETHSLARHVELHRRLLEPCVS